MIAADPRRYILMMLLFTFGVLGLFGGAGATGDGIQTATILFVCGCAYAIFLQIRAIFDGQNNRDLFNITPERTVTCWVLVAILSALALSGLVLAAGDGRAWAMIGWGMMGTGLIGGFLALRRGFDLKDAQS